METPDTAPPTVDEFTDPPPTAEPVAAPGPGPGRLVLGLVAALAAGAAVVPVWAFACAAFERRAPVAGVVLGGAVAWVLRQVSGRANVVNGIVAALITLAGCLVGGIVADLAILAAQNNIGFWDLVDQRETMDMWVETLKRSTNVVVWLVNAFAVYAAFAVARAWPKPKGAAAATEPPVSEYATATDEFADVEVEGDDGADAADDPDAERARDE